MFQVIDRPDRRAIITPVARLDFLLVGDRWSHRLAPASAGEDGPPIASSVEAPESAGPQSDPPSPTYQEVTLVAEPDMVRVFCLGQFGPNHFATTFAIRHLTDLPGGSLDHTLFEVDIAVRREATDRPLAATYTVHSPPSTLNIVSDYGIGWTWDDPHLIALFERPMGSPANHRFAVDEAGRAACRVQLVAPGDTGVRTNRLRYNWGISDQHPPG
jgi:hypothetical protein